MSVELHLPDLPEVPISLGPAADRPRVAMPWHLRIRQSFAAALPLVLMTVLALATWWLVKNSPQPLGEPKVAPAAQEPDYTMSTFSLDRFDAGGRLKLRIEGDRMRHYPATDRIEIDGVRIRSVAADGRVTVATAERAVANGDASEVQLIGGAELTSRDAAAQPLSMRSDFLHAFLVTERVVTDRPVFVDTGGSQIRAGGLVYDHPTRQLELLGRSRVVMSPRARAGASATPPAPAAAVRPQAGGSAR